MSVDVVENVTKTALLTLLDVRSPLTAIPPRGMFAVIHHLG